MCAIKFKIIYKTCVLKYATQAKIIRFIKYTMLKPAAHKICACVQLAELKTTWRIKITSSCLVFNSASCTHAQIFLFRRACRLLAAHEIFFVTNDEKYQTCLIFGLHVTNDENAINVARTRGNFVDPTCHE
jgi:hypothetical protein